MGNNRFLDDSAVVVPSNNNSSNVQPTPIPTSEPEIILEPTTNKSVNQTPVPASATTPINDKGKNYFDIINQFIQSQNNNSNNQDNKPQPPAKPDKPIYNYLRDPETGKVIVEPMNPNQIISSNDVNSLPVIDVIGERDQIKILYNKIQQDVVKSAVEIKLFLQLIKDETDLSKKKIYENKLKSLREDLDYNQKRKTILESML